MVDRVLGETSVASSEMDPFAQGYAVNDFDLDKHQAYDPGLRRSAGTCAVDRRGPALVVDSAVLAG